MQYPPSYVRIYAWTFSLLRSKSVLALSYVDQKTFMNVSIYHIMADSNLSRSDCWHHDVVVATSIAVHNKFQHGLERVGISDVSADGMACLSGVVRPSSDLPNLPLAPSWLADLGPRNPRVRHRNAAKGPSPRAFSLFSNLLPIHCCVVLQDFQDFCDARCNSSFCRETTLKTDSNYS